LHPDTVAKWVQCPQYRPRQSLPRSSRLDPFKARIVRLLETHPYSAQQIFQRLREEGFAGGFTIVSAPGPPATPGSLPQALLCPRRMRPTRLG
jgi:hypothetical protein